MPNPPLRGVRETLRSARRAQLVTVTEAQARSRSAPGWALEAADAARRELTALGRPPRTVRVEYLSGAFDLEHGTVSRTAPTQPLSPSSGLELAWLSTIERLYSSAPTLVLLLCTEFGPDHRQRAQRALTRMREQGWTVAAVIATGPVALELLAGRGDVRLLSGASAARQAAERHRRAT